MKFCKLFAVIATLASWLCPNSGWGENWPGWRGPRGDGSSLDKSVPIYWSPSSNVVWQTVLPGGHASPIVRQERVFTAGATENSQDRVLLALDRQTGKLLWQQTVVRAPLEQKQSENSYASGTPATDGEKVYVAFLDGPQMAVAAYDFSGNQVWLVRPCAFSSPHGFSTSPVLFKDKVILNADNREGSCVLALSRADGRTLWKIPQENRTLSYSTPFIRDLAGRTQMIHAGNKSVASYDPDTGALQWGIDGPSEEFVATPVYNEHAGLLFAISSWPARHILAIKPDGHGNVTSTHIAWRTTQGAPYVPSPISEGEFLLTISDTGIAHCYEASTGKILWQERLGKHHASPVSAKGLVYFLDDHGLMNVVKAGPQFVRIAQNALGEETYASPAISEGQIFIRGKQHLFCIGTR